jgi:hypothetical protein
VDRCSPSARHTAEDAVPRTDPFALCQHVGIYLRFPPSTIDSVRSDVALYRDGEGSVYPADTQAREGSLWVGNAARFVWEDLSLAIELTFAPFSIALKTPIRYYFPSFREGLELGEKAVHHYDHDTTFESSSAGESGERSPQ